MLYCGFTLTIINDDSDVKWNTYDYQNGKERKPRDACIYKELQKQLLLSLDFMSVLGEE